MRSRLLMAGVATALVASPAVVSASASASTGAPAAPSAKVKVTQYRMLLTFNNGESLKSGTRVRDVSRHRNGGVVVVDGGGKITKAKGVRGGAANFPNACRGCGRAMIEVKDKAGLDPGRRNFTFGSALKLTRQQGVFGSNVLQKGYFHEAGGQFKLQLDPGGIPSCVFFGSESRLKVTSAVGIANNKWHRVSCTRGTTGLAIRVDSKRRGFVPGTVGVINNAAPIRIGAKKAKPANKQFRGIVDNVYLRFLPTPPPSA
jgi:hypothetical protein